MVILRQISQFIFEDVAGGNEPIHTAANEYVRQQRQECGTAFRDIYPKDAWELRIHVA